MTQKRKATAAPPMSEGRMHWQAECVKPDPIGVMAEEHALQLELCDLLESIADCLPTDVNRTLAKVALKILTSTWPAHVQFEEVCLFPLLRRRLDPEAELQEALLQLEEEHEHDETAVGEISEGLAQIFESGFVNNPQMFGYMLRGFFESQRRHIYWENTIILPLAQRILTAADKIAMQKWIMESSHPWCRQRTQLQLREDIAAGSACGDCNYREKTNASRNGRGN